ncbi:hypothetical protein L195_g043102, partial [Trifolium pratense]
GLLRSAGLRVLGLPPLRLPYVTVFTVASVCSKELLCPLLVRGLLARVYSGSVLAVDPFTKF